MKKHAFLHKNFRHLDSEKKTIFVASAATMFLCLFPWYAEYPVYGEGTWINAFGGSWFLIGTAVLACTLVPLIHIGDELLETKKIKLPFDENRLYLGVSLQGLFLIILAWSVIQHTANAAYHAEVRYGVFLSSLAQFIVILTAILRMKDTKKQVVQDFFVPTPKEKAPKPKREKITEPLVTQEIKKEEPDHHHPQNLLDL